MGPGVTRRHRGEASYPRMPSPDRFRLSQTAADMDPDDTPRCGASLDPPHPMGAAHERFRLRPGCHLYRSTDGAWRLAQPDDRYERIHVPSDVGDALERISVGAQSRSAARARVGDPATFDAAVDALLQQGCLIPHEPTPSAASSHGAVVIDGHGAVADQVAQLLRGAGVEVTRLHAEALNDNAPAVVEKADLLLTCAGWLPDGQWLKLDSLTEALELTWHRLHIEAERFHIGPVSIPGRTPNYRDVRARRLAAARHPDELECAWAHLANPAQQPMLEPPPPAACVVAAGLLAADALAVLAGTPAPSQSYELELDMLTLVVQRHPVLALPREVLTSGVG